MLISFNSRTKAKHTLHKGFDYVTVGINTDLGGVEVRAYSAGGQCSSSCFIKHGVRVGAYVEKVIAELVSESIQASQAAIGMSDPADTQTTQRQST
jgi:hypothetical protein